MKVIKDKWFYYQLCVGILIIGALFSVYLYHMIMQQWLRNIDYPFSPVLFQGQFFSFFTYQSNFLLGVWFLASAVTFNKPQYWWKNQYTRIALTSYISVTCLTFMGFILPTMLIAKTINVGGVLGGLFFHLITPILMIVYLFMHQEKITMTNRQYFKKVFCLYLIYPLLYTGYLSSRFGMYLNDPLLKNIPYDIIFPYALLTPKDFDMGIGTALELIFSFIIVFIIAYVLFILTNIMYFFIIKASNKKQKGLQF